MTGGPTTGAPRQVRDRWRPSPPGQRLPNLRSDGDEAMEFAGRALAAA